MTAWPVGGVSVTIMVTEVADSGMYCDTLTWIGVGSTAAAGGCSACASRTMAGGDCMSMVGSPLTPARSTKALTWRGAGKINSSGCPATDDDGLKFEAAVATIR